MISLLFWVLSVLALSGADGIVEENSSEEYLTITRSYSPEELEYFAQVVRNLSKYEIGLRMTFDFFNQPTPRRTFLDHVFHVSSITPFSQNNEEYQEVEKFADFLKRLGHIYPDEESVTDDDSSSSEEVIEHPSFEEPLQVGSIRGIPGVHFPDYREIPITSFTCADKYVPGFYADLEIGCQVFHVCWEHRRESFLCPIGTTFNQAILACDYWYSNNCSLAPLFFDINVHAASEIFYEKPSEGFHEKIPYPEVFHPMEDAGLDKHVPEPHVPELHVSEPPLVDEHLPDIDWSRIVKFLPVKSKITIYPEHPEIVEKVTIEPTSVKRPHFHKHHGQPKVAVKLPKEKVPQLKPLHEFVHPVEVSLDDILGDRVASKHSHKFAETEKPKALPLPEIDPKFVVKPILIEKTKLKHRKPIYVRKETVKGKLHKPSKVYKKAVLTKVPEMVMRAFETAGTVLQRDILPLTKETLIKSHVKLSKSRKL